MSQNLIMRKNLLLLFYHLIFLFFANLCFIAYFLFTDIIIIVIIN